MYSSNSFIIIRLLILQTSLCKEARSSLPNWSLHFCKFCNIGANFGPFLGSSLIVLSHTAVGVRGIKLRVSHRYSQHFYWFLTLCTSEMLRYTYWFWALFFLALPFAWEILIFHQKLYCISHIFIHEEMSLYCV